MAKNFYITTPIYYINDLPHLGHYYITLAADILARYYRLKGDDVFFATGTDENSQKTVAAARAVMAPIKDYTDKMADAWRLIWDGLQISYSDFIRTTEERHRLAVEKFIKKVYEKGDIYKGKYEGFYCEGCETFKREDEFVDGLCPDHKIEPKFRSEENYFFALSKYQDRLLKYFEENPDFAQPATQRNEMLSFIKQGLKDQCISRLKQEWGIPVPFDETQTIWVWFDALINYISVLGYGSEDEKLPSFAKASEGRFEKFWPADLHLVGRDIFRFHSVLWPAMLMSADLPLPKKVFAHGFFTVNGQKMSKTLGNIIDPKGLAKEYGVDATRYLLLSVFPFGQDGDIDEGKLKEKYNADLANGLGNLISRIFTLIEKNYDGEISRKGKSPLPAGRQGNDLSIVDKYIEELKFYEALEEIFRAIEWANKFIEEKKLWQLVKENKTEGEKILSQLLGLISEIGKKLKPLMPETSEKILNSLSAEKITKGEPLFLRL